MELPINQIICGDWAEIAESLPAGSLHCIITSPPYWRQRDYGVKGQLGSEKTVEEHIEKLVAGFRELRRVLRDDGVLFLNYGDKYNGFAANVTQGGEISGKNQHARPYIKSGAGLSVKNLQSGNLIGLAWRLALALQADGWILRSDTIWAKAISFCDKYSGSTMPESINGWRWEKCRVKIKKGQIKRGGADTDGMFAHQPMNNAARDGLTAQYKDCPGCAKCEPNDGLVLRRGSWRPTRAHEYLFILVKTGNYYCDMEAVREEYRYDGRHDTILKPTKKYSSRNYGQNPNTLATEGVERWPSSGRNLRDVWTINPQPFSGAHYATFPEKLVEPCIKVATSQKGVCPKCGSQWARVVKFKINKIRPPEKGSLTTDTYMKSRQRGQNSLRDGFREGGNTTLGWRSTCGCDAGEPVPAIVYDPFMGSGTVAAVAAKLGRNYIGSEISEKYIKEQAKGRILQAETGITVPEQLAGQKGLFE